MLFPLPPSTRLLVQHGPRVGTVVSPTYRPTILTDEF